MTPDYWVAEGTNLMVVDLLEASERRHEEQEHASERRHREQMQALHGIWGFLFPLEEDGGAAVGFLVANVGQCRHLLKCQCRSMMIVMINVICCDITTSR